MLYYLGKGTEFKKEECKEYKTIEGALKTNPDGSVPAFDESGHPIGAVDAATVAAVTGQQDAQNATGEGAETATDGQNGAEPEKSTPETGNAENGANTKPEESETIIPQGTMRVTVICDGTLNLRRSADWGNGNICGRASRGQSYYVKAIHTVQGKKMVQTIDDIYLSGQSEHVQFEQL